MLVRISFIHSTWSLNDPQKNGVITPNNGVIGPCLKGHGDSRHAFCATDLRGVLRSPTSISDCTRTPPTGPMPPTHLSPVGQPRAWLWAWVGLGGARVDLYLLKSQEKRMQYVQQVWRPRFFLVPKDYGSHSYVNALVWQ